MSGVAPAGLDMRSAAPPMPKRRRVLFPELSGAQAFASTHPGDSMPTITGRSGIDLQIGTCPAPMAALLPGWPGNPWGPTGSMPPAMRPPPAFVPTGGVFQPVMQPPYWGPAGASSPGIAMTPCAAYGLPAHGNFCQGPQSGMQPWHAACPRGPGAQARAAQHAPRPFLFPRGMTSGLPQTAPAHAASSYGADVPDPSLLMPQKLPRLLSSPELAPPSMQGFLQGLSGHSSPADLHPPTHADAADAPRFVESRKITSEQQKQEQEQQQQQQPPPQLQLPANLQMQAPQLQTQLPQPKVQPPQVQPPQVQPHEQQQLQAARLQSGTITSEHQPQQTPQPPQPQPHQQQQLMQPDGGHMEMFAKDAMTLRKGVTVRPSSDISHERLLGNADSMRKLAQRRQLYNWSFERKLYRPCTAIIEALRCDEEARQLQYAGA